MKRNLNNKGVTLIELIVSFVLVAVAIIYFYQTLYTVKKLYGESQKDTKNFVDVNYAYRIIDELNSQCLSDGYNTEECLENIKNYKETDDNFLAEGITLNSEGNFTKLEFTINSRQYNMYFYNKEEIVLEDETEED